jgi:hypothetical protein
VRTITAAGLTTGISRVLLVGLTAAALGPVAGRAAEPVVPLPDPSLSVLLPTPPPGMGEADPVALQAKIDELTAQVGGLTAERDRLLAAVALFDALYDPMEADRLLLTELRKQLPATRPEAEAYLDRMQRLALISDPARLGPVASRVKEVAPIYLDWRDQQFATPQEANAAYLESGASGFDTNWTLFRNAVLMTVSNRLDVVLSVLDRVK